MVDKGVLYGVMASLIAHGLVLGLGGAPTPRVPEAPPRLMEARLVSEAPLAHLPEPLRDKASRPPPQPDPQPRKSPRLAASPQPAHLPQPVVKPAPPSEVAPTPVVAVTTAASPASAAVPAGSAATAGPAASGAVSGTPTGAASPSYSPPSFGASYLHNPKPAYPLMARRRGLQGTVRLDVKVSAEGIPISVKVRESSGHESLDEAATIAVWHWRFTPAKRGGEAVEGAVIVPVRFNLEGDSAG
ncbi:TonB family protein [Zoogloea sp.]|uniref:TonB family protein n=1 Tax=Zoogloea sp. TaxID=49181 RepID=UPI002633F06D|nr:TonB family protein [Zoogloea sp.]MDD3355278.1 TonB family protein [Zoogloea sp.]